MSKIVVLDYGLGNIANVARAVLKFSEKVTITDNKNDIKLASHLILPGVGAFGDAMKELHDRGLVDVIINHAAMGKPLLGICLGMQLLLSDSEEFGDHQGLDILPGSVNVIPTYRDNILWRKIPHIGWSGLHLKIDQDHSIFRSVNNSCEVYFVHSYMANMHNHNHVIAHIDYKGISIPAIINKDNVFGMQFHPEKSAKPGLQLIENFLNIQT